MEEMEELKIQCPVCGHTEFEAIKMIDSSNTIGRQRIKWIAANSTSFWNHGHTVNAMTCTRCRYILLFAEDSRKPKEKE